MHEQALTFDCEGDNLAGVLSLPHQPRSIGVIVVVGGPQYRAGSHRQFVLLARRLADEGYACLRFDYRGMGDSQGSPRRFEDVDADIAAAIGALQRQVPQLTRVALWGLCDGASAALMYVQRTRDPRVAGLALLNPWVRSPQSLARTHLRHYYLARLRQRTFWTKLLRGHVARTAVRELMDKLLTGARGADGVPTGFQARMAEGWADFSGEILLVISEADLTAREFLDLAGSEPAWQSAWRRKAAQRVNLPQADHTCSTPAARQRTEDAVLHWLAPLVRPR